MNIGALGALAGGIGGGLQQAMLMKALMGKGTPAAPKSGVPGAPGSILTTGAMPPPTSAASAFGPPIEGGPTGVPAGPLGGMTPGAPGVPPTGGIGGETPLQNAMMAQRFGMLPQNPGLSLPGLG